MENKTVYTLCVIAVCVAVTVFTRALPFLAFGKRELPPFMKYLSGVLPTSIMVILVAYCLKGTDFTSASHGLPEVLSCLLVFVTHKIGKNMYISIIVGTICYMVLLRVM